MRKFITLAFLSYVVAHTFYFIYTITHVSYTRRDLSKRELSDGPLVLKEGVIAKKGKLIGSAKKRKGNDMKKKKIIKGNVIKPVKSAKSKVIQQVELDSGFLKEFVKRASSIFEKESLIYFTLVNGAFERLTMNWLCNVADFVGTHRRLLIVSTYEELCNNVTKEYGKELNCIHLNLPDFEEDLDWGEQKYISYLTIRSKLMRALTENSIRYVLVETDSVWFRDPVELFLNATIVDDADVVVPVKGFTHKGDRLAFSPMLVEPTNTSIALFKEMTKRLQGSNSLYDQDVLNELCSVQYHGVVCRNFEYDEIADGNWFHLDDDKKTSMKPYIVNNNFYVGVKNKEARQAINDLWFLSKSGHCAPTKIQRARKKFRTESV